MAASATFALKVAVWFRRGRLFMVSPDSLGTACPLSGRNSTYRSVQISETSSQSVPGIARTIVTPPAGMTSAQFDQAVAAGYGAMSTDQGWYDPTGLRRLLGVSNSNNTNTS